LSIKVDIGGFREKAKEYGKAADDVDKVVASAMNEWGISVIRSARSKHRYNVQTGNLEKATELQDTNQTGRLQIVLWVNDAIARYGKYIHNGFKSWAPDRFLDGAVERLLPRLPILLEARLRRLFK